MSHLEDFMANIQPSTPMGPELHRGLYIAMRADILDEVAEYIEGNPEAVARRALAEVSPPTRRRLWAEFARLDGRDEA